MSAEEEKDDGDDDCVDGRWQWPLVVLVRIDQPDDFNCLGGS